MQLHKPYWMVIAGVWLIASAVFMWLALMPTPIPEAYIDDKVLHLLSSFVLTVPLAIFLPRMRYVWFAGVVLLAGGVMVEYLQTFVAARQPSFDDVLANTVGVMLGLLIGMVFRACRKNRRCRISDTR